MFGIGRIVSALVESLGRVYSAIVEYPYRSMAVGFYLASVSGAYFAGTRTVDTPGSSVPLRQYEAPSGPLDQLRASAPDRAKQSRVPPKNKTDTVRVVTREFTTKTDTVTRFLDSPDVDLNISQPRLTLESEIESLPYNFLLLPTVDGRPTVNVSEEMTVVEALRPDNASSIRIEYDHPFSRWEIGPLASISGTYASSIKTSGKLGGYIQYKDIRLEGAYRFSPMLDNTGPNITLQWSPTWQDF